MAIVDGHPKSKRPGLRTSKLERLYKSQRQPKGPLEGLLATAPEYPEESVRKTVDLPFSPEDLMRKHASELAAPAVNLIRQILEKHDKAIIEEFKAQLDNATATERERCLSIVREYFDFGGQVEDPIAKIERRIQEGS